MNCQSFAILATVVISVTAIRLSTSSEVCGTDGVIYPNKCAFIKQQCKGDTTLQWQPMKFCQISSRLIPNDDMDEGSDKSSRKPLEESKKFGKDAFATVCGSNGQTYENGCAFKLASCADSSVTVAFPGKCGDCSEENVCRETHQMKPKYVLGQLKKICGTDGRKYEDYCAFKRARCQLMKDGGGYLEIANQPLACKGKRP